jgi:hypothetical protein
MSRAVKLEVATSDTEVRTRSEMRIFGSRVFGASDSMIDAAIASWPQTATGTGT